MPYGQKNLSQTLTLANVAHYCAGRSMRQSAKAPSPDRPVLPQSRPEMIVSEIQKPLPVIQLDRVAAIANMVAHIALHNRLPKTR